jgi:hypothetical protein
MNTLREVINRQKTQQNRQKDVKKEILNRLTNRILFFAKNNEFKFIYTVPIMLFGFVNYNVKDITQYLYLHLKKEGFYVVIVDNDKLFISWDIKDTIKNVKEKETTDKDNKFINIRPLLNFNK